jgi:hypothetical protein
MDLTFLSLSIVLLPKSTLTNLDCWEWLRRRPRGDASCEWLCSSRKVLQVITYEGPDQCLSRRQQNKGFIAEWEKVMTPVVDYLQTFDFVDAKSIGLLGYSLGSFLFARAACFERRITTACVLTGFSMCLRHSVALFLRPAKQHLDQGDEENLTT